MDLLGLVKGLGFGAECEEIGMRAMCAWLCSGTKTQGLD